ncbi:MAG TPA: serine hydrolase domain-containing protein [bacterium]|nr:serine hydrolase domain-containing protein [bacterium]
MRYSMFFLFLSVATLFAACDNDSDTEPMIDNDTTQPVDDTVDEDQPDQADETDLSDSSDLSAPSDEDALLPDADMIPFCQEAAPLVAPYIDTTGVANKAVGMIVRVESPALSETCTFGAREKGTTVPPTGDELWVIGSVSKMITAHLIARKIAAGELTLADTAASHLPQEWSVPAGPGDEASTVEQLLTHTTGLPHYPPTLQASLDAVAGLDDMYAAWEGYTLNDLITDLAATTIATAPGSAYLYSDFGFALAQQVAENVYGASYPDIVDDLATLTGLTNTTAPERLTEAQKGRLFYGHAGPQLVPATRPVITPIFTGDGFLYSDADDLGRLLRVFAGIDEPPDAMTADALALATQKIFHREVSGVPVDQGLGIGVITSGDYTFYKKNGTSTGATTAFLWDAQHHIGVVVAANVIPVAEGINASACALFAAVAARSGITVPAEVITACQVPF